MSSRLILGCALLSLLLLLAGCLGESPSTPSTSPAPEYSAPTPSTSDTTPTSSTTPTPSYPVSNASASPIGDPFHIVFINASLGDATLLYTANQTVLFDTGPAEMALRTIDQLESRGVQKIDLLVLSSDDPAFVGATPILLQRYPVDEIWYNGVNYSSSTWEAIRPYLEANKTRVVQYGDSKSWGEFKLQVVNPSRPLVLSSPEADAIALKASYGSFCALLFSNSVAGASSADSNVATGGVESKILSGNLSLACPVLRVSHHGASNAASFQLLERVQPRDAIISVGPNAPDNLYPNPAMLRRLYLRNATIWTTDRLGTLTVGSDGTTYSIGSQARRDLAYGKFIETVVSRGASYWTVKK